MGSSWVPCISWDAIAAIGTLLTVIVAAGAAGISLKQAREFRDQTEKQLRESRSLRALDFSAAASIQFGEAWQNLSINFGNWSSLEAENPEIVSSVLLLDRKNIEDFNYVLNFFGRAATALKHDLVDEEILEELLAYRYVSFWRKFGLYLDRQFNEKPQLRELYKNSIELNERWRV